MGSSKISLLGVRAQIRVYMHAPERVVEHDNQEYIGLPSSTVHDPVRLPLSPSSPLPPRLSPSPRQHVGRAWDRSYLLTSLLGGNKAIRTVS